MNDRFSGLAEFDKLLNAADGCAAEYDFAQLPKDGPAFQEAKRTACDLIRRNDIEELSRAIASSGTVGTLLKIWSADDGLADEHDGLLNVRVILVAAKAQREIGGK